MITLYGRTYWDVEVHAPLASLGCGKGKVDTEVTVAIGGFAGNAARAIGSRLPSKSVRVVTLTAPQDLARLRDSLSTDVVLDAICSNDGRLAWPAVTVVINPSAECRILRDPMEHTNDLWRIEGVSEESLASELHVFGRLPISFVQALLRRAHARGAKAAWCGGDGLPEELESQLDFLSVNSAEAGVLLATDGRSPVESANALAHRARVPGAIRLVTGRGASPTAVAYWEGDEVRCHAAPRERIEPDRIKTLFRAGDVFAANFLVFAYCDALDVPGALDAATEVTARFIQGEELGHE